MNKFTRTNNSFRDDPAARPTLAKHRLFGDAVSVGEPVQIQGDAELRQEIHTSLEMLAKQRLLEAEDEANVLLSKAKKEAAALLEKANAQVKEMLAQAQSQVDQIRDNAHEEGFKAGFQEGYADATEQVSQETVELLRGANTLVDGAYQAEKLVLKQFEQQALAIISHVVRKILRRELADSPETLMGMIQQAIDSLYISGKVQVVVNPTILQDLREFANATQQAVDGMNRFEFIADAGLDPFQIFIIGQDGCFDLSPLAQLEQLTSALEPQLQLPRPDLINEAIEAAQVELTTDGPPSVETASAPSDEALSAESEATLQALAEGLSPTTNTQFETLLEETLNEEALTIEPDSSVLEASTEAETIIQAAPYEFPNLDDLADEDRDA
ncbi:MAG: H+transporting two-sector ATPase subunit [Vampirovibrio sp.]|nr:H+transporting two-sector ATPase subunit [Vampirovibrio sp.]